MLLGTKNMFKVNRKEQENKSICKIGYIFSSLHFSFWKKKLRIKYEEVFFETMSCWDDGAEGIYDNWILQKSFDQENNGDTQHYF